LHQKITELATENFIACNKKLLSYGQKISYFASKNYRAIDSKFRDLQQKITELRAENFIPCIKKFHS
jgi:hypothetical protein